MTCGVCPTKTRPRSKRILKIATTVLWGVYRFKRGFGGQVVRHIGAWVSVLSPARWWLFQQARRFRKTTGLSA